MGDQKLFQSGIRILFYLVKHSRPDISNAVRELSQVLDGANKAAFLEMHLLIMCLTQKILD